MLILAAATIGCASPGTPRPPSLNLPVIVHDLHAERAGDTVRLTFTAPRRTTDRLPIKGSITADLCRQTATAPCISVTRKTIPAGPASTVTLEDPLATPLTTDPAVLLTYRVQLFNAKGRSAGLSDPAYAAAGTAPPPITALTVLASAQGAVLRWQSSPAASTIQIDRLRTSVPLPAPKSTPAKSSPLQSPAEPVQISLHVGPTDAGGAIDATAQFGQSYTYTATRIHTLTIAGHTLEVRSAPSVTAAIDMRDTFPPRIPQGLTVVPAAGSSIDLSWEPNTEPDFAGYIVYRGNSTAPPVRLNPQPLTSPAFHDATTQPGRTYRYSISAIDATGNESTRSADVAETAGSQ